jgi:hypothetical protein
VLVRTWKLRRAPMASADAGERNPAELDSLRRRAHEETEI